MIDVLIPVERFAAICAEPDESSAVRARSTAGVSEADWLEARGCWLSVLAAGESPDLAVRFARAYACARLGRGEVDGDRTLEMAQPRDAPVLPFSPRPTRAAQDHVDVTIEMPKVAVQPAVLPFAPAGRRLQRFDTQTGQPLAEPVWTDEPGPHPRR